jgi:PST family polysaccharide transporter
VTGIRLLDHRERWFHIEQVRADLRRHSVRSGVIALSARGSLILLNIASVMVLARILRPQDFGVLAMILPLTILFNSIANYALQTSIIHDEQLDHAKASAIFRGAALRNLALAVLMAGVGPVLGRVYHDPRATGVAVAWAAVLYIATLSAVHEALLKRQMRFGKVMSANIAGMVLGIGVALGAALLGARHWALFLQFAVMDVFRTAAVWRLCDWRPSLRPEQSQIKHVVDYWRNLAAFRAVGWLGDHPDRILVGYLGGATTLGLYDSARRWAFYPFTELYMSLSDVAVATFSRVAHDAQRYRAFVSRGLLPILALPLPAIAFVGVEAKNAVLIMLGDQWLAAVPFVRLMCVAAFVGSLGKISPWLFLSRGETARQLRWSLMFQVPVMLGSVLIGSRFGALGVARGFAFGVRVALPSLAWPCAAYPFVLSMCSASPRVQWSLPGCGSSCRRLEAGSRMSVVSYRTSWCDSHVHGFYVLAWFCPAAGAPRRKYRRLCELRVPRSGLHAQTARDAVVSAP